MTSISCKKKLDCGPVSLNSWTPAANSDGSYDGPGLSRVSSVISIETISENAVIGGKCGERQLSRQFVEPAPVSVFRKYGGLFMAILSSIFFSVAFLIVKLLKNAGFQAYGSAVLFNMGVIIPCVVIMTFHEFGPGCKNRERIFLNIWPLSSEKKRIVLYFLMLQGGLQGLSVVLRSLSLQYISVGDMTVIVFSSPVVVTILARFIVKEPCGVISIVTACFTLVGVFLITKPPFLTGATEFNQNTLYGTSFALGALFALSMKFVVTRKIKEAHYLLMTLFLGCGGLVISFPLFLAFEDMVLIIPKDTYECFLVAGLLVAFCAIACINLALKMEDAGPVSLFRSCDVIFAFFLQYIFLGVIPDMLSSIGACIVVFGVFITVGRKWISTLPEENNFRQKCWFCVRY